MDRKCPQKVKINEYLDKQADLKRSGLAYYDAGLERHIEECPQCAREMREQRDLFENLSGLEQYEPPADFTASLMTRLPQQQARRPISIWTLLAIGLLMLMPVLIIIGTADWLAAKYSELALINTIIDALLSKGWELINSALHTVSNGATMLLNLLRALWMLIKAYPLHFVTLVLAAAALFIIMFRLIQASQRENYA